MTFQFESGQHWGNRQDDLCMKHLTEPNPSSYLIKSTGEQNIFMLGIHLNLNMHFEAKVYEIKGDFERVSLALVCNLLLPFYT
jgi:hypothetical protein